MRNFRCRCGLYNNREYYRLQYIGRLTICRYPFILHPHPNLTSGLDHLGQDFANRRQFIIRKPSDLEVLIEMIAILNQCNKVKSISISKGIWILWYNTLLWAVNFQSFYRVLNDSHRPVKNNIPVIL